ncbi:MAG: metallophosphatase family protein [Lachnospiraceae bacterium]
MIYVTGDLHSEFQRFAKKQRMHLPFELTEDDYIIVCGDFGLLWAKDSRFQYDLKWLSNLPFRVLWIQGNHENYNMIEEYPVEKWKGGKVRHIIREKIILLERGQVFKIDEKTFFTMGGASSNDIQGGILDKKSSTYKRDRMRAIKRGLPYRVLNETWWPQELPKEAELQEGRDNLENVGYQVDYVISHCASNDLQKKLINCLSGTVHRARTYKYDILTDYFQELENKLQYHHWFCGHYHQDLCIDQKHTILYELIIRV